jgi:NTE family protein
MKVADFTRHPQVISTLKDLRRDRIHQKPFSDVIDDEGHQYVDLVQGGGGVHGFSLLGYNYVLEQMGLRFLCLAGTSTGAINTLLLASMGELNEAKAERLIKVFAEKDLMDFIDGEPAVRDLTKSIMQNEEGRVRQFYRLVRHGWSITRLLSQNLGLNPGYEFFNWLKKILNEYGIERSSDLVTKRYRLPENIHMRPEIGGDISHLNAGLVIISADITTQTKVEFPKMASLYWQYPEDVNPAHFVRASMSIPMFFQPFVLDNLPKGEEKQRFWQKWAHYYGPIPEHVKFVDGGLIANFPIDAFHVQKVPRLPSFGIKLGMKRNQPNESYTLGHFANDMISAMRQVHHYEFLMNNRDYEHLIQSVDVGDHNWYNFAISNEDKIDLFIRGAKAADEFLRKFNWHEYKALRREIVGGH